jgi:hypothetical protein
VTVGHESSAVSSRALNEPFSSKSVESFRVSARTEERGTTRRSAAVGNAIGLGCGTLLLIPIAFVMAVYVPVLLVPMLAGYALLVGGVVKGAQGGLAVTSVLLGALLTCISIVLLFIYAP